MNEFMHQTTYTKLHISFWLINGKIHKIQRMYGIQTVNT